MTEQMMKNESKTLFRNGQILNWGTEEIAERARRLQVFWEGEMFSTETIEQSPL